MPSIRGLRSRNSDRALTPEEADELGKIGEGQVDVDDAALDLLGQEDDAVVREGMEKRAAHSFLPLEAAGSIGIGVNALLVLGVLPALLGGMADAVVVSGISLDWMSQLMNHLGGRPGISDNGNLTIDCRLAMPLPDPHAARALEAVDRAARGRDNGIPRQLQQPVCQQRRQVFQRQHVGAVGGGAVGVLVGFHEHRGDADGMICGTFGTTWLHLHYIDQVLGKRAGAKGKQHGRCAAEDGVSQNGAA